MKHILIIPTHLEAKDAIIDHVQELRDISHLEEWAYVILDSSSKEDRHINEEAILECKKKMPDLRIYHIIQDEFDCAIKTVIHDQRIFDLLIGNQFSYGKMMNRISMIAIILDADYIHRRDSDTFIQKDASPLEIENIFLGSQFEDKEIMMVGSSYCGNWGIDYSDIEDFSILKKLFRLSKPYYSDEQLTKYINDKYVMGSKEKYEGKDFFSFLQSDYIDAGNFSYQNIFKYIPVNPAVCTSGTDYIYHDYIDILKKGRLYHNRRVLHQYNDNRYNAIDYTSYTKAKLYSRLVKIFNSQMKKDLMDKKIDLNNIDVAVSDAYKKILKKDDIDQLLMNMINDFYDSYLSIKDKKYDEILEYIKDNKQDIIESTKSKINDYTILIDHWKDIVNYLSSQFQNELKEFEVLLK